MKQSFSPVDLYGNMSVECKNIRCEHCDDKNICLLFKILIDEKGQCAFFEQKKASDGGH